MKHLFILIAIFSFASCSKKNDPLLQEIEYQKESKPIKKDTILPNVEIVSPRLYVQFNTDTVVKIRYSDNLAVSRIELFENGVSIQAGGYGRNGRSQPDSVEWKYNIGRFNEQSILTAVVTDIAGLKQETSVTVTAKSCGCTPY